VGLNEGKKAKIENFYRRYGRIYFRSRGMGFLNKIKKFQL
jgi:hypothetical protein